MALAAGLFGKLPRHGDFVRRGMADETADHWDLWLSEALAAQKARLGERFEATHDAAPCLRFLLPGQAGWRLGVLCPSIDAVGRRFFLVLQIDGLSAGEALAWGAEAARGLEDLAYRALAEAIDADGLLALVHTLAAGLNPLEATAWSGLGASIAGGGVWWREACEGAGAEWRAEGLGEGRLEMMFIETATEAAA